MVMRLGSFCILWVIIITVGIPIVVNTDLYAQRPEETLDWKIETSKKKFYPGEPVLLTLKISNIGKHEDKIDFGTDGIEAFSFEIHDHLNNIVAKKGKIQRSGLARIGTLSVGPGETSKKSIVLNQWCSTLLTPDQYQITCQIEYRLRSEATRKPGTEKMYVAGPIHQAQLVIDIELIESNASKYKEILDNLAKYEIEDEKKSFRDWQKERGLAREMIVFTEWESAVPYQLNVLMVENYTSIKQDAINSLAKSKQLNAATNLMSIVDDPSFKDVRINIIEAVYKLRETGKAEIINATDKFVSKYKRPVISKPMD